LHADQACGLAAYIFYLRARAPLAALRPCGLAALYIYMYELVGLAAENGIPGSPRCTAQHPTYFFKASQVYIYQASKEFV